MKEYPTRFVLFVHFLGPQLPTATTTKSAEPPKKQKRTNTKSVKTVEPEYVNHDDVNSSDDGGESDDSDIDI